MTIKIRHDNVTYTASTPEEAVAIGALLHKQDAEKPDAISAGMRAEAAIRKVMRSRHQATVRELKQATSSKRIAVEEWDKALQALVEAGELRIDVSPRGKKTVSLLKGENQ